MKTASPILAGALAAATALPALGHAGRRFEIQVDAAGQLIAQGVNTGADDGAPSTRPYLNAIHGHWSNFVSGTGASADLPSFDLYDPPAALEGASLTLTLDDAFRWVAPPAMPMADTVPAFAPLDAGETLFVSYGGATLSTDAFGQSLTLLDPVPVGGQDDLDLSYEIGQVPTDTIYILQFTLGTDAAGLGDSGPVYAVLSPQGPTYHHASLFTEAYLGTPVPEPASLAILVIGGAAIQTRRRR
jgi:hypothetical protein